MPRQSDLQVHTCRRQLDRARQQLRQCTHLSQAPARPSPLPSCTLTARIHPISTPTRACLLSRAQATRPWPLAAAGQQHGHHAAASASCEPAAVSTAHTRRQRAHSHNPHDPGGARVAGASRQLCSMHWCYSCATRLLNVCTSSSWLACSNCSSVQHAQLISHLCVSAVVSSWPRNRRRSGDRVQEPGGDAQVL
jgi:hypothetical protein